MGEVLAGSQKRKFYKNKKKKSSQAASLEESEAATESLRSLKQRSKDYMRVISGQLQRRKLPTKECGTGEKSSNLS